ncbi:MAG: hypothetical protein IPK16_07925 [Anaerolineales bacterium]|nr:hypothetical protein [Anaerolineales bacterium]
MKGHCLTPERQESTPAAPLRIDVQRALKLFLFTLVVPVTAAFVLDQVAKTLPILTMAAVVICIPLATVMVNRAVLGDLDRIFAIVAPELPLEEEQAPTTTGADPGLPLEVDSLS